MTRILLSLCLLFFLVPFTGGAQAPVFAWQKCVGSPYLDYGGSVAPTSDGGSISVGYVSGGGGDVTGFQGLEDYWVVKQDANGVIQWSVCLGGAWQDMGSVVKQLPDGTYLVGGEEASQQGTGNVTTTNHGGLDAWLVKLSATGSIIWQNSYGGGSNEYVGDIKSTSDGGFILVGSTEAGTNPVPGNHGDYDIWVMKVNADGGMAWQKCIGGSQDDWGYGVAVASDGYVVSGWTSSFDGDATANHGSHDLMAAKVDLSGNLVWAVPLGGSGYDEGYSVEVAPDGSGYLFAGLTRSVDFDVAGNHGATLSSGWQDAWIIKVAPNGSRIWQHCYGGSYNEAAYSITATADGGFLVAGSAQSLDGDVSCMPANIPQDGGTAGWVFKINSNSALQWDKVVSGDYYDVELYAREAPGGSIMINGYTALSDIPGYHHDVTNTVGDIYVGKLSPVAPAVVLVPPPLNICSGAPVTFTAGFTGPTTGLTYRWFKNGVDQNDNSPIYSSTSFVNGDQLYCQVYYPDGVCTVPQFVTSNTVTMSISATVAPVIAISGPAAAVCAGSPSSFSAAVVGGSGSGSYQWLVNGGPSGASASFSSTTLNDGDLISCVYSDATVCVVPGQIISNVITARVDPLVSVSVQIATETDVVCAGTAVNFSSTISGGGSAPGYQWMVNGSPVVVGSGSGGSGGSSGGSGSGGSGGSASFAGGALADGDIVSCVLSSGAACSSPNPATSNAITMTVKPVLNAGVSLGFAPATICSGKPVVFTASATDAGAVPDYAWMVNGVAVGAGGATFSSSTLANGDVVGVEVSDPAGCVVPADASVTVVVNASPTVGGGGAVLLSKGQSYTLDLPVTGNIVGYSWQPGVWLSDSTVVNPVATPLATTGYTLTVVSPEGCMASDSILLKVFSKLAIPAAFSPNADGHNDIFYVIGGPIGSKIGDLAVYDRWGQAVFAVHGVAPDDPAYGWDGNINGRPAPTGTYVYALRMVFADGTQQVVKGTVILVR